MASEVERIIMLIKKSYNQPIIFHMLMAHLRDVLAKKTPMYEMADDWSRILV
ncbi:hypothetical protein ENBRE01_3529, partial [Enteropsectra breve]